MSSHEKKKSAEKSASDLQNNPDNKCPKKEGDNCLVPGSFSDSDPIGGGG